jgi:hypothetical protein
MKTVKAVIVIGAIVLFAQIPQLLLYSGVVSAETKYQYTKDDCVKCHAAQVKNIAEAGGKHRNVPCVGCHPGHPPAVKNPIAQCTKCHLRTKKGHFTVSGCLNCHMNPHTPLKITFKDGQPCLNCHESQIQLLSESKSKHSVLDCTICHQGKHKTIPECRNCHGSPHPAGIMRKFPKCDDCHTAAHDPYNSAAPAANVPAEQPPPGQTLVVPAR